MKKTIPKLLTLVCLLAALMGLSIVTAHAETVTGTISGGNEYRYHEDKTPVSQWGAFTSTKLKYFTRDDTGATVPAYCMEPSVRSPQGDAEYSSVSWSGLSWNQRYAVTLAMAYGYGGNYGFDMHPDCAQLATQAIIWEFVCGYRGTTYPYTLYDTTCKELFHYAGDDVAVAYDITRTLCTTTACSWARMNTARPSTPIFAAQAAAERCSASMWRAARRSIASTRMGRTVPSMSLKHPSTCCPTSRSIRQVGWNTAMWPAAVRLSSRCWSACGRIQS